MRVRNMWFGLTILILMSRVPGASGQGSTITTYVGPSLPANGAAALTQAIDNPRSVVTDGAGGFFVSSGAQSRVYHIASNGMLALIAGSSVGYSGDGGPASSAQLSGPSGLALDSSGILYIADTGNNSIRKVTPDGVISSIAGTGTAGFSGDGGLATAAQLSGPVGVAVDGAGNLYIADTNNNRVRRVSPSGVIQTVAGNGTYGDPGSGGAATLVPLGMPVSVAIDVAGNFYIGDALGIHRVSTTGTMTKFVGVVFSGGRGSFCQVSGDGGPAVSGSVCGPYGMVFDGAGNLYIADRSNGRIRRVSAVDGTISTVAGSGQSLADGGPALAARLNGPSGVAIDVSGNLYIADTGDNIVRKVDANGLIATVAGRAPAGFSGDGGPSTLARVNRPLSVAVDPSLNLYIADTENNRIRKVTPAGIITTVAGTGVQGYSGDGGPAVLAQVSRPYSVTVDGQGNLYFTDGEGFSAHVRKIGSDGVIETLATTAAVGPFSNGLQLPNIYGIAIDPAGNLYVRGLYTILRVTPAGMVTTIAGTGIGGYSGDGGPATQAQIDIMRQMAFDAAGNLYFGDDNRVRKINTSGIITTVAGNGLRTQGNTVGDGGPATSAQLDFATGVAIDGSGNLFIVDSFNNRVRKVDSGGIISTVAGNGTAGFSGDGGSPTLAQLSSPGEVAVDVDGNLYILDLDNSRIRRIPSGLIPPLAITSTSPLPSAAVGDRYVWRLGVTGGNPPYSNWTVSSGSLPSGLHLDAVTGTISGNAAGPAGSTFSVGVTDSAGSTASGTFQIPIAANFVITTTTPLTPSTLGSLYMYALSAAGGIAPYTWSISAGNLPAGLNLNSANGMVSGTPSGVPGIYSFTATAQDSSGVQASRSFQLTLQAPATTASPRGVFAQIASGAGWKTSITLVNLSAGTITAQVNLHFDDGGAMSLPFTFPQSGASMTTSTLNLTLGPNQTIVAETEASTLGVNVGWADVQASGPINGFAIFRLRGSGIPDSEGTSLLDSRSSTSLVFPYDETNRFRTGVALANPAAVAQNVTATLFDDNGNSLATTLISLPPLGHTSFYFDERFLQAFGHVGIVKLQSASGITGLGLRFNPSGSFTSVPDIPQF